MSDIFTLSVNMAKEGISEFEGMWIVTTLTDV